VRPIAFRLAEIMVTRAILGRLGCSHALERPSDMGKMRILVCEWTLIDGLDQRSARSSLLMYLESRLDDQGATHTARRSAGSMVWRPGNSRTLESPIRDLLSKRNAKKRQSSC
jgi:hypothetical protein